VVWGTLALLLAVSCALAPVRAAASDFLSLFRVERFVLIDVDPERMQEIAEAVEDTMTFGQSEFDGEAQYEIVASVEEAAARAGFVPRSLTGQGTLTSVGVTGEQTISFTPDVEAMRLVFSNLGLDPELIPGNIDGKTLTMTWGAGIAQTYGDPQADGLSLMQMPAPVVDIPDGTDMDQLGTAMLMLLGMSEEEAARLSKDIDWTTTLVIPVPRDHMNSIQEVTVNGNSGLAFRTDSYWDEVNETRVEPPEVLIWQEGGFIYAITGKGDLLIIANSLQ
jgi:hypothetical protein